MENSDFRNSEYLNSEDLKKVKISDEIIAVCAENAAMKTAGVSSLSEKVTPAFSKGKFVKTSHSRRIKVNQSADGVTVDLYLKIKYGYKIPEVTWDVQKKVKDEIVSMTERKVKGINIHVQGVEK